MELLPYFRGMRWTFVATVSAALALSGAALAGPVVKPVLRVDADNALRGSHFKAHELVRVVFVTDVRKIRTIRASARGSFAALLPSQTDSCGSLRIRATGSSGDVAAIAVSLGLCPPPSATGTQSGSNEAPPQTTTLPDPHGPPTINPGPQ